MVDENQNVRPQDNGWLCVNLLPQVLILPLLFCRFNVFLNRKIVKQQRDGETGTIT